MLNSNAHGYTFKTSIYNALMQGESAPASIINALEQSDGSRLPFDVVVLIRGGGSSLDLSCFDDYSLNARLAVITSYSIHYTKLYDWCARHACCCWMNRRWASTRCRAAVPGALGDRGLHVRRAGKEREQPRLAGPERVAHQSYNFV